MTHHRELHSREAGSALLVVMFLLLIATILGMALLYTTDTDLKVSKAYGERTNALAETDSAVNEVLWRLNLTPGAVPPPKGSEVSVNSLVNYDASLRYDASAVVSNLVDDDGDGTTDEPDEINLLRDWTVRIVLTPGESHPGAPWEVTDASVAAGPPWGSKLVVPTIQPQASWKEYSTSDASSVEVLSARFMLDTDTTLGDSENDGAEIVFYDPDGANDAADDKNTLTGLGGDGNAATDSPFNITWSDGTTTYPARGVPVMLVSALANIRRGGNVVAKRRIEAQVAGPLTASNLKAICGCSDVTLGSSGLTDSFRSHEGSYGTGPTYEMGDIGCNADLNCAGTIMGNAEAFGSITGADDVEHNATAGGSISGTPGDLKRPNWDPAPVPCDCTKDVTYLVNWSKTHNNNPSSGSCKGPAINLTGGETCTLDGGVYYYSSISIKGGGMIQVGDVSGGPVIIYLSGNADLGGNGIVNANRPQDLQIIASTTSPADIKHQGTFDYNGIIYAPNTTVTIGGDPNIYGYVLADQVNCNGNPKVHFDEDLNEVFRKPSSVRVVAWHEVQP